MLVVDEVEKRVFRTDELIQEIDCYYRISAVIVIASNSANFRSGFLGFLNSANDFYFLAKVISGFLGFLNSAK